MNAALTAAIALLILAGAAVAETAADGLETLRAQQLQKGQCGLFLWSRAEQQSFVAVAYDQPAVARLKLNGREQQLVRTGFSGEPMHGHFAHQEYAEGRVSIDLDFETARPLQDGAVITRGTVRLQGEAGAETLTAVGGMVACKK